MLIKKFFLLIAVMFVAFKLPAQLCSGSLGDPIINITFGAGPNPGPMLTTTKNLNYVTTECPNDGYYTIRNNTSRCFGNTWHTLNTDHTGDANGYFMLINASYQKSEFYIDTLKGLCPNTTYEFAAWVMNVIVPYSCGGNTIKPNLTFNIEKTDGTIIQTYNTGDIAASPSPVWNQYGSFFTTPSAVSSVVLRLINNSMGGCGNDIAIDDITFRPCGPQLTPSIRGVSGTVKELCFGNNADVTMDCKVSTGYANPSYSWQQSRDTGKTWTNIAGETSTTLVRKFTSSTPAAAYLYRLSVGEASNIGVTNCRVASSALTVNVNSSPFNSITSNSPLCQGDPITLSAIPATQDAIYLWSGVNSFADTGSLVMINNAEIVRSGKYYLQATSSKGCHKTDSTTILVKPSPVVTTAFSNKTICEGQSIVLGSSGGAFYQWSPSASLSSAAIANPVATPSSTTAYTIVVSNTVSCTDTAVVTITVIPKPIASAGPNKIIFEGQSVQLDGNVRGINTSFSWSPALFINNIHSLKPSVKPLNSINYVLTATSNDGCGSSSDSVNVHVYRSVVIPNAFSPNGDGINDTWNIPGLATYDDLELSVFNRYGQPVFTAKNYNQQWNGTYNGKPLPVGTYYYLLDLKLGLPKRSGFVVILH